MNAIQCRDLTKSYPGFSLEPLTFSLPQGTILGLVGENGAGKSTTLKLLMNAIPRDGGTVSLLGVDNQSPGSRSAKEDIGVVLDEACFPRSLTPKEIGTMLGYTYRQWDAAAFQGYLARFQLDPKKPFKDLSRGMKMKLALAAALSHGAKLLILDEATSGLDPIARDEILDILINFTRDETHSVVLSSHITSDLEKVCDYIAFLHRGTLRLFLAKGDAPL
jgi:ABC-2 type transport system ATP-binding protein